MVGKPHKLLHMTSPLKAITVVMLMNCNTAFALAPTTAVPESTTSSMLHMLLGLSVVLAIIFLASWLLRRVGINSAGQQAALLKPISTLALGARERIVVVEIENQWLVLGITQTQISTLHVLPKGDIPAAALSTIADHPFAVKLRDLLHRPGK